MLCLEAISHLRPHLHIAYSPRATHLNYLPGPAAQVRDFELAARHSLACNSKHVKQREANALNRLYCVAKAHDVGLACACQLYFGTCDPFLERVSLGFEEQKVGSVIGTRTLRVSPRDRNASPAVGWCDANIFSQYCYKCK
jgi:hypothetical protein